MLPSRSDEGQTFLDSCLLEGDSDLERRTGRGKRRALLISILLQLLIVSALVLIPLLSKGENISASVFFSPPVPYSPVHPRPIIDHHPVPRNPIIRPLYQPPRIPDHLVTDDPTPPNLPDQPQPVGDYIPGVPPTPGVPGGARTVDAHRETTAVETHTTPPPVRRKVSQGVQDAMLIRRVQPMYPVLAIQLRREGRVELHAIISTDGTIQSLEVISGDPLFIQSATAAVDQWRYRPTLLNGQPIEIDTRITVIYTLTH